MNGLYKLCLFITSFIPLWISIIFKIFTEAIDANFSCYGREFIGSSVFILSICLVNAVSIIYIKVGIKRARSTTGRYERCKIINAEKEKTITSEYLLSYILPLFAFDFKDWKEIALFLLYFIILAFLCIKNNNVYVNLLFELVGYSYFNCEIEMELSGNLKRVTIITKQDLNSKIGHELTIVSLNKPIYYDVVN